MFTQPDLDLLLQRMRATGTTRLVLRRGKSRLLLTLPEGAGQPVPDSPPVSPPRRLAVTSPAIGTCVARGDGDGLPPLAAGAAVSPGEILAYVAQGALRLPVCATEAGILLIPPPAPGTVLGYGDHILTLEVAP